MSKLELIDQYLTGGVSAGGNNLMVSFPKLILALALAAILSYVLGKIYVSYGTSLSNRKKLANNFMILAATTTLVITVVKSSLALSLGLVGALSIVRFRAAIKEPEELLYLFLVIGLGLGLGANLFLVTITAFVVISLLIIFNSKFSKYGSSDFHSMNLLISGGRSEEMTEKNFVNILKKHCFEVKLKRLNSMNSEIEASFLVHFKSFNDLTKAKEELELLDDSIQITYLERNVV